MKKSTTIAAVGIGLEAGLCCVGNLMGTGMVWRLATAQGALKKAFWAGVSVAAVATNLWFIYAVGDQVAELYTKAKLEEDEAEDSVEEF